MPESRTLQLDQPHDHLGDGVIRLRRFDDSDAAMLELVRTDPTILQWMSVLPRPAEQFLEWAERGRDDGSIMFFAICQADGIALGGVAVSAEPDFRAGLGYWLLPQGRGRGLATRALRLLSLWLIEALGCQRCELWVDVANGASRRVAERAGYRPEGVLRSYAIVHGRRVDAAFYSLLPADVEESPSPAAREP
jgi:ribosomal-protein-alanine N-acetyltransferase